MPTYQYACTACEHRLEAVQKFTDDSLTVCPQCSGMLRKVYGSVGVVFKGSGWYRNDSRGGPVSPNSDSHDSKSDSKSDGKSDGGSETKSDKPAAADSSSKKKLETAASSASAGSGSGSSGSGSSSPHTSGSSTSGSGKQLSKSAGSSATVPA